MVPEHVPARRRIAAVSPCRQSGMSNTSTPPLEMLLERLQELKAFKHPAQEEGEKYLQEGAH